MMLSAICRLSCYPDRDTVTASCAWIAAPIRGSQHLCVGRLSRGVRRSRPFAIDPTQTLVDCAADLPLLMNRKERMGGRTSDLSSYLPARIPVLEENDPSEAFRAHINTLSPTTGLVAVSRYS